MTSQEAKTILAAFRPESPDAADPEVAAALEQAGRDPALKAWLERHTAFQSQLRESFRAIPVPDDLSRRIHSSSNIVPLAEPTPANEPEGRLSSVFGGARRSRRFNVNFNDWLPLLARLGSIWTVKRPKGRAPLNTHRLSSRPVSRRLESRRSWFMAARRDASSGGTLPPAWQARVWWAAASGILVMASLSLFWIRGPREDSFAVFRTRMAQAALRQYRMDIVTNDLPQIRQFLARNRAPADFQLAGALARLAPVGAGLLSWKDQRVAMVCLDSGAGDETSILYLFVVGRSAVARPPASTPEFRPVSKLRTASWTEGSHAYLLATPSDAENLRQYF